MHEAKVRCPTTTEQWDAIIIGAGPAGSAAAITLARMGYLVLQVDAKRFPRHKACGGCLNRVSLDFLHSLVDANDRLWDHVTPIGRCTLWHGRRSFELPMPEGVAIDRAVLDQCLVDAAQRAGVCFQASTQAKVMGVDAGWRHIQLNTREATRLSSARVVVVAAGLGNRCCGDLSDLRQTVASSSRVGVEAMLEQPTGESRRLRSGLQMIVAKCGYVGIAELDNHRWHLAAAVDRPALQRLGPQKLVESIVREAGADPLPLDGVTWRGTPALTARAPRLGAERVFLVGDAAGYIEPFTGEGIRWALQSGIGVGPFAAAGVERWHAELIHDWEDWYSANVARNQGLCRRITRGLQSPAARWLVHQALRWQPGIANIVIKRLNERTSK